MVEGWTAVQRRASILPVRMSSSQVVATAGSGRAGNSRVALRGGATRQNSKRGVILAIADAWIHFPADDSAEVDQLGDVRPRRSYRVLVSGWAVLRAGVWFAGNRFAPASMAATFRPT